MKPLKSSVWLTLITMVVWCSSGTLFANELDWHASGKKGVVVAGRTGSAEAGFEILKAGGNAADAAVATLLENVAGGAWTAAQNSVEKRLKMRLFAVSFDQSTTGGFRAR